LGGTCSADSFPGTYSPQDLRGFVLGQSVVVGTAPSSSGSISTAYGSGGYRAVSGSMPITIVAPPPSVQLNFSLLDKVKVFAINIVNNFIDKTFAAK
jgi:hypothetical protein